MKRMFGLAAIALIIASTSGCTTYREASLSDDTQYSASVDDIQQIPFDNLNALGIEEGETAFVVVSNVGKDPIIFADLENSPRLPRDKLFGRGLSELPKSLDFFGTKASPKCQTLVSPDGTYITICP